MPRKPGNSVAVVAIIIPLTFVPLLPHVSHSTGRLLLLLGYAMFGIGLLLFLMIAALLLARLISHPLPPAPLAHRSGSDLAR